MKNKYKYFFACFALITASLVFTSCNDDDDATGASLLDYVKPTVTITASSNNAVISESSIDPDSPDEITITATIPAPVAVNISIPLVQTGGNADGSDYSVGTIVIPALETSGSTKVVFNQTGNIEGNETIVIEPAGNVANAIVSSFVFNATISDDYINGALDLVLAWDGTVSDGDLVIESFCDIDYDLLLFDDAFGFVGYVAGSSACPEEAALSGLPDGTYYLVSDLYDNPYSGLGFTDAIPLSLSWSQEYFPDTTGSISSNLDTLNMTASTGGLIVVLTVTNGYEYTLTEYL